MSNTYTPEDVKQMISILPKDFIERHILDVLNSGEEPTRWRKEDRDLYAITKTFNDEFIKEVLAFNKEEDEGYNEDTNEFPDKSDEKIVESYKRLIKQDITKEEERLIANIGQRIYSFRYSDPEENIDSAFVQRIYLYAVLEEAFGVARELAEEYLSN